MTTVEAAVRWRVVRRGRRGWVPCCSWRGQAEAVVVLARLAERLPGVAFRLQAEEAQR